MQKRMIGVYLNSTERAALAQLAERERRGLRDQAAAIIISELQRAGLLPQNGELAPIAAQPAEREANQ